MQDSARTYCNMSGDPSRTLALVKILGSGHLGWLGSCLARDEVLFHQLCGLEKSQMVS